MNRLLENPVLLIGALRAVAMAILAFAPTLFTNDQLDAVFYALSLLLPIVSLAFTKVSSAAYKDDLQTAYETIPDGVTDA